jgi:hypothetical protein
MDDESIEDIVRPNVSDTSNDNSTLIIPDMVDNIELLKRPSQEDLFRPQLSA